MTPDIHSSNKTYAGVLAPRKICSPAGFSANSFYGSSPLAATKQHTSVKTYSRLKSPSPRRSLFDGLQVVADVAAAGSRQVRSPRSVLRESRHVAHGNSPFKPPASPREPIVPPEKIGFPNIGNTCYFNAVLQCLFALPSFVESVVEWCDRIDEANNHVAASDDKENLADSAAAAGDENGKFRLLRATRMLAKAKMAGKQSEVR